MNMNFLRATLRILAVIVALSISVTATAYGGNHHWDTLTPRVGKSKVEVILDDPPYPTEKFMRIGYTLKTWEFERDNLELNKIVVLNAKTGGELLTLEGQNLPLIWKDPLPEFPYPVDPIYNYYLSIQLPLPLDAKLPRTIVHRLVFFDKKRMKTVTMKGGRFAPRIHETPLAISSPVRGDRLAFINQSTNDYHFNVLIFTDGAIYTPERFAVDTLQFDESLTSYYAGDPARNESYFNYGEPLYAVADGTVIRVVDGLPENNGNTHDAPPDTFEDYAGNYLVLDIGQGRYAGYMHCIPGSFRVREGDQVREGDELARLGNSGNSDAPHLHFQIADDPDILKSRGIPFVLKAYTKVGDAETGLTQDPQGITDSMMEETTLFNAQ